MRSGVTFHLDEEDPGDGPVDADSLVEEVESPGAAGGAAGGGRGLPRLVAARGAGHHAGAGPPRCDLPHRRQALLRRPGQQQPRPHRRGPGPGARGRRLAGAAGRGRRGRRHLAVRRTRESAEILAERLGLDLVEEPGFAEMEFGVWDGLTFAEVRERYPDEIAGLARVARRGAGRRRVVPRGRGAGPGRPGAGPRRLRREDGPRGQPRHPDQDPGRPRRRRAALGAVPDGAVDRVGERGVVRPAAADSRQTPARGSMRLYNAQPPGAGQMLDPQRW